MLIFFQQTAKNRHEYKQKMSAVQLKKQVQSAECGRSQPKWRQAETGRCNEMRVKSRGRACPIRSERRTNSELKVQ